MLCYLYRALWYNYVMLFVPCTVVQLCYVICTVPFGTIMLCYLYRALWYNYVMLFVLCTVVQLCYVNQQNVLYN